QHGGRSGRHSRRPDGGVAPRRRGTASAPSRVTRVPARYFAYSNLGIAFSTSLVAPARYDLALLLLELPDGDRHVVLAHAQEAALGDDRVGYRAVRRDDQVVDDADLLAFVLVHRLAVCVGRRPASRYASPRNVTPRTYSASKPVAASVSEPLQVRLLPGNLWT